MINLRHRKWVTWTFVLIYLLLSTRTGNASFWCQGTENSSHLESNPVGECWTVCHPEEEDHPSSDDASRAEVAVSAIVDDCFDSPVYFSAITHSTQTDPKHKIDVSEIGSIGLTFIPANSSWDARFAALLRASQLPPPQALMALRAVVLLH